MAESICVRIARVAGCWLHSKFLLVKFCALMGSEAQVRVDAGMTLFLGAVDFSGLQPDLAGNKRIVRVTICAVVASEVHSPSNDEV
mgnify:CR=1 FL=1